MLERRTVSGSDDEATALSSAGGDPVVVAPHGVFVLVCDRRGRRVVIGRTRPITLKAA
jgi:hypothetical protein